MQVGEVYELTFDINTSYGNLLGRGSLLEVMSVTRVHQDDIIEVKCYQTNIHYICDLMNVFTFSKFIQPTPFSSAQKQAWPKRILTTVHTVPGTPQTYPIPPGTIQLPLGAAPIQAPPGITPQAIAILKEMYSSTDRPIFTMLKCECGCASIGINKHSDYCPLYEKDTM